MLFRSPAPPAPVAPFGKLQRGGAVAVQNCEFFTFRGGAVAHFDHNVLYFFTVDLWSYGIRFWPTVLIRFSRGQTVQFCSAAAFGCSNK